MIRSLKIEQIEKLLREPLVEPNFLFEWIKDTKFLGKIEESELIFANQKQYRFSVQLKKNNVTSIGTGRDTTRATALSKAIGEAIERFAMHTIFRQKTPLELTYTINFGTDRSFEIVKSTDIFRIEDSAFKTSNGWSSHFSFEQAITNSISEAFERHILLKSFYKYGWNGFFASEVKSDNFKMYSLISRLKVSEHQAGIVVFRHPLYKGGLFGYLCDREEKILKSPKWLHALFEAQDAFDSAKRSKSGQFEFLNTPIGRYANYWLDFSGWTFNTTASNFLEIDNSISGKLVCFEVSKFFSMPQKYYVSLVGYGDFIPLIFSKPIGLKSEKYFRSVLDFHGISFPPPYYHPVL